MENKQRLVIHAPTPGALERARRNAVNMHKAMPEVELEIVVNAAAVAAALAKPDPADCWLIICGNTLKAIGAQAPEGLRVVDAAVAHIARRQWEGWAYLRA